MRTHLIAAAGAMILVMTGTGPVVGEADPGHIALLAGGCYNCHGTEGRSPGAMPTIAGTDAAELESKMLAFKADSAPGTTVMNRLAKGLSEDEIKALAAYFAAIDPHGGN